MTAEFLAIALVVLVGATVVTMVKEFFSKSWHLEEGIVYIEGQPYQPVQLTAQAQRLPRPVPQALPVPVYQAQPRVVPAYQTQPKVVPAFHATRHAAPRRQPVPEPALALAAESRA